MSMVVYIEPDVYVYFVIVSGVSLWKLSIMAFLWANDDSKERLRNVVYLQLRCISRSASRTAIRPVCHSASHTKGDVRQDGFQLSMDSFR